MKNILVIDDDKFILRILTRVLQEQGYRTDTAETGREAMEKVNAQPYDLALIDVRLPDTDGIDLLSKIHATKPEMIKIVITGFASMDDGVKVLDMGADAYLVKPFGREELLNIIKQQLPRH